MVQKSCFYLTTPSLLFSPETFGVLIAYSSRAGFQSPGPSPVSLLSCPATAPSLAHQHWPSPTHRAHQPFPPCVFHLPRHTLPTPPPTQPLTGHTAAVQITHSAVRTQDQPFSASAASFSSPNLHTNRHLSEKKVTFEAKTHLGAGCWGEGAFSFHGVQTLRQAALSQLGSLLSPRQAWLPSWLAI